ncbi:hypothetical protein AWB91_08895 [Mycobacterium paraense]|uniref:Uncharacterized protein n=1 Tax=Mycobacterium paraense TaxID=767916 RepID=A0ABX3VS12_9MYCO|nr:hypothetical protein [Mycobacterium paraense]ORW33234.1 hypothetical protein AWB91_08895 [Mycobacterium paraense]ORW38433.1 hypothetical protein AWB88_17820 [Mycobacterium paraense]
MAILKCGGCGDIFDAPTGIFHCTDECRDNEHRRLLGKAPLETRQVRRPSSTTRSMFGHNPYLDEFRNRTPEQRRDLTLREAWAELAAQDAECLPLDSIHRKPRSK